jgi:hypothetical protein
MQRFRVGDKPKRIMGKKILQAVERSANKASAWRRLECRACGHNVIGLCPLKNILTSARSRAAASRSGVRISPAEKSFGSQPPKKHGAHYPAAPAPPPAGVKPQPPPTPAQKPPTSQAKEQILQGSRHGKAPKQSPPPPLKALPVSLSTHLNADTFPGYVPNLSA